MKAECAIVLCWGGDATPGAGVAVPAGKMEEAVTMLRSFIEYLELHVAVRKLQKEEPSNDEHSTTTTE